MTTVEVTANVWGQLCNRVHEACHGVMVSIQLVNPDGTTSTLAKDLPLQSVLWDDKSDPCNNNLVIEAGRSGEKPLQHVVVEPIHIRLKQDSEGGRYNRLQAVAENGTTVVVFHPGISPGLLKGLAL